MSGGRSLLGQRDEEDVVHAFVVASEAVAGMHAEAARASRITRVPGVASGRRPP